MQPRKDGEDWQGPSLSFPNPSWTRMNVTQLDVHPAHMALVSCAVFWMTSIWVVATRFGPLSMQWHAHLGRPVPSVSLRRPFVPSRISKEREARWGPVQSSAIVHAIEPKPLKPSGSVIAGLLGACEQQQSSL